MNYDINLVWSTLVPLTPEGMDRLNGIVEGVFRISKKESDGKFYVIFIGSATDIKNELSLLLSKEDSFLKQGEFSFRYAPIKGDEKRKAVEKQMYKQYVPQYNPKEPISPLEVKVNLN
ncbi:MAG: hypothetical protein PHY72_02730 [Candidatus Pacebacteria bacterium]|nr:hypothetical protein [Candidatus Paceibacterota bacterium]